MSLGTKLLVAMVAGPALLAAGTVHAAASALHSGVAANPSPHPRKPIPTTAATTDRETLRLRGTQREQNSRLGDPPPTRTQRKNPKKSATGTPPREERVNTSDAKQDLRIHDAGCKPTQMQGKVDAPNICPPDKPEIENPIKRATVRRIVRPRPEDVTWEEVRSETKSLVFPGLSVKVQPNGRTLVNLDTIVYTDESKVSTSTVTLLGFPVTVQATPISYTWHFGDGSPALTTSSPGNPYPSKEITHKYMRRGAVALTVTTNYAARFNVANTGWQYVAGTISATGPATQLLVREAVPVLVDPGR